MYDTLSVRNVIIHVTNNEGKLLKCVQNKPVEYELYACGGYSFKASNNN